MIGDLVGFVAATVLRGVPYIQVPTTLLAQVDSSVGGKTAVNHPLGKNLIGAFYQPILVVADLATLTTLPPEEYLAGLAEVIKYGVIADEAFLGFLEEQAGPVRSLDPEALEHVVLTSCAIKASVVGKDEREEGLRSILNFGHTIAHALLVRWRQDGGQPPTGQEPNRGVLPAHPGRGGPRHPHYLTSRGVSGRARRSHQVRRHRR